METAKYIFYDFLVSLSGPFPYLLGFFPPGIAKGAVCGPETLPNTYRLGPTLTPPESRGPAL